MSSSREKKGNRFRRMYESFFEYLREFEAEIGTARKDEDPIYAKTPENLPHSHVPVRFRLTQVPGRESLS
jgi:hypothetical protein